MSSKQHILRAGLRYGLVGGLIAVGIFLLLFALDGDPIGTARFFDFILLPLFIFFAIKELRDYRQRGYMAYWQGMTVGFLTYLLIALLSALFLYFFLQFASQETFLGYQQENIKLLTDDPQKWISEIGEGSYRKAVRNMEQLSIVEVAFDDFLKKLLIGLFLTSFISIFLKRTPNENNLNPSEHLES
jgi:hypothetical protein